MVTVAGAAQAENIITLNQTGCQFIEPEGGDLEFHTSTPKDCKTINKKSGEKRIDNHEVLHLKPGRYIFRVKNVNVPYELGFYLRAANRAIIPFAPRVSGGGLAEGQTQDYAVDLSPGSYFYSCPFNPTPNYRLEVAK